MHYKKRKLHKLYSIPIGLCNKINHNRLYLVSYSIPLSCMVVLLLGLGVIFAPDLFGGVSGNKGYAVEAGEGSSNSMARVAPAPTIALNVTSDTSDGYGNTVAGQVTTAPGAGTAYRSHKVKVTGSNILSYDLKISGPVNLTPSDGASTIVGGAEGKTGTEMSASDSNIWGYAWGEDSEAVEEMTYNTMSTSGTGLTCDNPSSYSVNCERKLVFGANFGVDANPGTYTAGVTLSLTATPAVVTYTLSYNANSGSNAPTAQTVDSADASYQFTIKGKESMARTGYNFLGWSDSNSATVANANFAPGQTLTLQKDSPTKVLYAVWKATLDSITTLQEMSPEICRGVDVGATKILRDIRDNNEYAIVKLVDDNCWMQENLRLSGIRTLTSADSDVSGSWVLPADVSSWNANSYTAVQVKTGSTNLYGWKQGFGNYYSWPAATAGTGVLVTAKGGLASGSICPKGWRLPTMTQFQTLFGINGANLGGDYVTRLTNIQATPYKFLTAGFYSEYGLNDASSRGVYWSSTSYDSDNAYNMFFKSSEFILSPDLFSTLYHRYYGIPVRCVAQY